MKKEREELIQPDLPSMVYTADLGKAITAEVRRGGDPYKIARYFDVPVATVLRIQKRTRIIAAILGRNPHGSKGVTTEQQENGNQNTEEDR